MDVVDRTRLLSPWGLGDGYLCGRNGISRECFERGRQQIKEEVRGFQLCCQWLALYRRRKTVNPAIGTSYKLKHAVEEWAGEYVSNGTFIAAVIHLGISYTLCGDLPNIMIGISSKLVDEGRTGGPDKSSLVPGVGGNRFD
jgi:hypothetical protein